MTDLLAPIDVVRTLWDRLQERAWDDVGHVLHPDVVLEYPVTGERFEGADNVLAINAEYPEGWSIDVRGLWADGDDVLALVRVPLGDTVAWCTQRATVADGVVVSASEIWADEGAEPAPHWRAPYRTAPTPSAPNEETP